MLPKAETYDELIAKFKWQIPDHYNIGSDMCDHWVTHDPDRTAIIYDTGTSDPQNISFIELYRAANRLANALIAKGIRRGDRVAILLPQRPETAISHIALYKMGAVALPIANLFGVDAVTYRLNTSSATAIITDNIGIEKLADATNDLEHLKHIINVESHGNAGEDFHALCAKASDQFSPPTTALDDPSMMIFTSGTTGHPKGALHGHRVVLGHIPGIQMLHDGFPENGDVMWTPADWAWAGGLLNCMIPSLRFGVPIVASPRAKFDPEWAFHMIEKHSVKNAFIPPTALKIMRGVNDPLARHDFQMRSIFSGGEALGAETYDWAMETLGLTINEGFGQTECNVVIASCQKMGISRRGSMGKPVPGHEVAVINEDGEICKTGTVGKIAIKRPDPVMFLNYWNNEEDTKKKFIGDWMVTGDQGYADKDGYLFFFGRDDDVITSNGYRIGPGEIEDCLISHPAVALAAAVGKPDPLRTEIVKAYLTLSPGIEESVELADDIRDYVRTRLAAHEAPREIKFVSSMPMTTTGKVIRRTLRDEAIREAEDAQINHNPTV